MRGGSYMGLDRDFPFNIEQVVGLLPMKIRRPVSNGVYTDCPFCGDARGKLKVNYENNTWRCNYCGEKGGMLSLYSRLNGNLSNSQAYWRICDELLIQADNDKTYDCPLTDKIKQCAPSVSRAETPIIHKTLSALLKLLTLSEEHREHLKNIRCLTDDQINKIGFKSTPPFYKCDKIARTLLNSGYTLEGVPGFYKRNGIWTVMFCSYTKGVLIPVRTIDGLIQGLQIRLDVPLKNDDSDKFGAKYIWHSSGSKPYGTSPGGPVQFLGNKSAERVYITEGYLKSYIAHCLSGETFAAMLSANSTAALNELFSTLANNGTKTIVEVLDTDKYKNKNVAAGAIKVRELAMEYGMNYETPVWNPNFNGIDDFLIAQKRSYEEDSKKIKEKPILQEKKQNYRIYQLDIREGNPVRPYAFSNIEKLYETGLTEPPATEYCLVCDDIITSGIDDNNTLEYIRQQYALNLPENYSGRAIAPSDIIELYDGYKSRFFYCNINGFRKTSFSPESVKVIDFY